MDEPGKREQATDFGETAGKASSSEGPPAKKHKSEDESSSRGGDVLITAESQAQTNADRMVVASLNHRCREAILSSPFEATVTANRLGPLMQYARETCLQPTHKPGQVYLRCECGLEEEDVLVQVRVRDGFTFNGPIHISAGFSWHRDEQSVQRVRLRLAHARLKRRRRR